MTMSDDKPDMPDMPDISAYIPNLSDYSAYVLSISGYSAYVPDISGYIPNPSDYLPAPANYTPDVSKMTIDRYVPMGMAGVLPYSEWYPEASGLAALEAIGQLSLKEAVSGKWRAEWHAIHTYHMHLVDIDDRDEGWKSKVQVLHDSLSGILGMPMPSDMKECLNGVFERVKKTLEEA